MTEDSATSHDAGGAPRAPRLPWWRRRRWWLLVGAVLAVLLAAVLVVYVLMIRMPGKSHRGPLPATTAAQRTLSEDLRRDVEALATGIGDRSLPSGGLGKAATLLDGWLRGAGYRVRRQSFEARGQPCDNLEVEIRGAQRPAEIVVVGAHYDSVAGASGANDNGSGVAALMALARSFAAARPARTLRFVAFANEEPPYFQTADMGSLAYAKAARARGDQVVAMLCLETIGYYSDAKGSQRYPFPLSVFYPSTGNFVAFVGNTASRQLVRRVVEVFRRTTPFPSEGAALPGFIPGVGWSDHWSFWQADYPAVMATDTAPFRYPHYHTARDTPDKLDYERLARVVEGLEKVIRDLLAR